ncbi:hypothetical protein RDMS_09590 [Deinococcus sp. RL]|uniref:DUF5693 family protein n=1 Tax=Deinococcus sp. RL TaxID=1489678 RepID=UPI0004D73751|nr:DUF5693 family protein [Deinococcus sp. RL]KEF33934.1 hypothetical protein RDMS_09590 [Deinococcus sp. RL]
MTDPAPTPPPPVRPGLTPPSAPGGTLAPAAPLPPASRSRLTLPLLGAILLALLPALLLAWDRVTYEQGQKTVALVMDYPALAVQAQRVGLTPQALLDRYKALGVNGVAVYEDVIGNREQRGDLYVKRGADLAAENPGAGVNPQWVYMRALRPGALDDLPGRYTIPTRTVRVAGQTWLEWPTDPSFLPAGPNTALIADLKRQGLVTVYRPYDDVAVKNPGGDWPDVPFIAFTGDEVIGARTPERLERIDRAMGSRLPALVEGTTQRGLDTLIADRGAVRTFAMNPSWQNRLAPEEVASKYNLAARERGHRLLYLRPYPTVNETEALLSRTTELLRRSGLTVGAPQVRPYDPNPTLRALSLLGPLAAALLLALSFPLPRLGLLVMAGVTGLAFALNSLDGFQPFAGGALLAAVTFPALGLVLRRSRVTDWFLATGLSLVGVLFVSALGASRESVLGLEPFRGVGLTLLVPLVLVALSFLPRQDLRKTARELYARPIRLGDLAVMGLGLAVFALVFLRRGNVSAVGVSDAEAQLRQGLQDTIVRPRFKELAGHPLALVGLSGALPGYFSPLLILGGVVGQASILNTFSHFHTPLLISAARCFIGLGVGLLLGLVAIGVVKSLLRLWQTWGKGGASRPSPVAGEGNRA